MYRYEYETISCDVSGWGMVAGNVYTIENYRSIIDNIALKRYNTLVLVFIRVLLLFIFKEDLLWVERFLCGNVYL